MEESKITYPRVKVREEEEEEEDEEFFASEDESFVQEETCSLPSTRILESLSLQHDSSVPRISSGKQSQSSPSVSRISDDATASISIVKGGKTIKEIDEENRIRASSIPRPRAVISSPDNDWLVRSRNRLARERSANPEEDNLGIKSLDQVKDRCSRAAGPRKGSDEPSYHNNGRTTKKSPEQKVPKQKTSLRKSRPEWVSDW